MLPISGNPLGPGGYGDLRRRREIRPKKKIEEIMIKRKTWVKFAKIGEENPWMQVFVFVSMVCICIVCITVHTTD